MVHYRFWWDVNYAFDWLLCIINLFGVRKFRFVIALVFLHNLCCLPRIVCCWVSLEKAYIKLTRPLEDNSISLSYCFHGWIISLFAERKQVKRFAPPPVKLQIEKQLELKDCASNTVKVWSSACNLELIDLVCKYW